jgi:hypothetical protein
MPLCSLLENAIGAVGGELVGHDVARQGPLVSLARIPEQQEWHRSSKVEMNIASAALKSL